tara:strand:- start:2308 stop:2583 length:276 start_codon:yes stop_codon:yes gene_type:complete
MKEMIKKMFSRDAWVGWVIIVMSIWFIYMSIDPWINNRDEFIRILGMVLGGGLVSTVIIMWILNLTLPKDDSTDHYQEWLDSRFREEQDEE